MSVAWRDMQRGLYTVRLFFSVVQVGPAEIANPGGILERGFCCWCARIGSEDPVRPFLLWSHPGSAACFKTDLDSIWNASGRDELDFENVKGEEYANNVLLLHDFSLYVVSVGYLFLSA